MLRISTFNAPLISIIAIIGSFATVSGGYWDITRHSLSEVDTFFTTAHLILYLGIGMVALASFSGAMLLRRTNVAGNQGARALLSWSRLAVVGSVVQLVAGPFDFWWHSAFGFDPVLLSPPHAMLIIGIAITSYSALSGSVRLWQTGHQGSIDGFLFSKKLTGPLLMIASATFWMQLNLVIYLFSIDGFVRVSVGDFTSPSALILLAVPGILILATVARVTRRFGYATITAAVFLISTILTALIPRGIFFFIPVVLATLVPVATFDRLMNAKERSMRVGWRILAIAPFTIIMYFPWTWALVHFPGAYQIVGPSLQSTASEILKDMLQMTTAFLVPWILVAFLAANRLMNRWVGSLSLPQLGEQT